MGSILSRDLWRDVQPNDLAVPFLLAADVDGTLLGSDEGEAQLKALVESRPGGLCLALVTGRSLLSVLALVEARRLPRPDYISSSVGTELFASSDPENVMGQRYAARVSASWNIETVYALGEGAGIWRQDFADGQPRFQAGFYWDGQPETLAAFHERLSGLSGSHILASHSHYIDVFPELVGKGEVVRFLQEELRIDPDRVVVAGDSGNDREMFETGFKGIVPINALDELKAIACRTWHYHSSLPSSLGVIDGLRHFGFIE
jgi:HAD superfamily hydrolase (TIGR01484 family)